MDPSQKIRVLVVDDLPLMVGGIVGEINAQADMTVSAQRDKASSPSAAYRIGSVSAFGSRYF